MKFAFNDMEFCDRVLHIEITPAPDDDSNSHGCSVIALNVNSRLLASQSGFFRKILENSLVESNQTQVSLKINSSEEAALMDVLNFMYIHSLSATTIPDLKQVQMVAEKFEVASCIRYCGKKLSMSVDQHELGNSDDVSVQPLKDAAKKFLVDRYRDLSTRKSLEEAMELPLSALEVVLGSDGLHVVSEEDVFDFIVKWGVVHFPKIEERREILTARLARFINFSYVGTWKLNKVIFGCRQLVNEEVCRMGINSVYANAGFCYGQRMLVNVDGEDRFIKRSYKLRPVKVIYINTPIFRCTVFFNLSKEECIRCLFRERESVLSQHFFLGRLRCFSLVAKCRKNSRSSLDHFDLFLLKHSSGKSCTTSAKSCTIDYEFQVLMKSSLEGCYESKYKAHQQTFRACKQAGKRNLFGVSWTDFIADDSEYFIDGILHLRAQLTLCPQPKIIPAPTTEWVPLNESYV